MSDTRLLSFADAIQEALDQSMAADESVIVIGEGVPDPKAIFNTTAGLQQKFGKQRVFDMPLSENGLTGVCIGAAISGMRPVMVHQRIDFALLAMDQLVNNAAKWAYMFDRQVSVPLVVRVLIGRGWGQGPQHSQSLQAMFAQVPGLKVVMPMTAHDAKGMMISAIKDNNPVIFIEHRWLHHVKDHVPQHAIEVPLDKAQILKKGTDLTIAGFSYMAYESLIAANALEAQGVSVEVLDMRSIRPLDIASVMTSVQKTGHLLVADTAFQTGSISGELITQVVEQGFSVLKSAPGRICSPDHPVPTSQYMAETYYPDPQMIANQVLHKLNIDPTTIDKSNLSARLKRTNPHDVPNQEFNGPF